MALLEVLVVQQNYWGLRLVGILTNKGKMLDGIVATKRGRWLYSTNLVSRGDLLSRDRIPRLLLVTVTGWANAPRLMGGVSYCDDIVHLLEP